jgi:surfeit locus 1 family protein
MKYAKSAGLLVRAFLIERNSPFMSSRMILPFLFGAVGTAILIWLGVWQVSRMEEKAAVVAQIEQRISAAPVALPSVLSEGRDRYLPVTVQGQFTSDELFLLASERGIGPGVHVVGAFLTDDGRRIMVDRGFVANAARNVARPELVGPVMVTGNLHWPRDSDRFTPAPDVGSNLWFARDVPMMAAFLQTEEAFVIARTTSEPTPFATPDPVDTAGIPDNHLQYAITWFLLACVWSGMTAFLLWRIRQKRA